MLSLILWCACHSLDTHLSFSEVRQRILILCVIPGDAVLLNGLRAARIRSRSRCKEVTHARSPGSTRLGSARVDAASSECTAKNTSSHSRSSVNHERAYDTQGRCRCCWTRSSSRFDEDASVFRRHATP